MVTARPLIRGEAVGPLLRLDHPISFWGGVDSGTGRIVDPRHPDCGHSIRGTVLAIPAAVGSSSSSAILLELIRCGTAPAAILLGQVDAILPLGVVVARELGYPIVPILELPFDQLAGFEQGSVLRVGADGSICPT